MQMDDRNYLCGVQYPDSTNLSRRSTLHERYATDPYRWHRWVFDHLTLPPLARILELGAGPGYLWRENKDRIPSGWTIVLSDLSRGMLTEAVNTLTLETGQLHLLQQDAQWVACTDHLFDAVIANHMLYHVPDSSRVLQEARRVLGPSGVLYAATNGRQHMADLHTLIERWHNGRPWKPTPLSWTLEAGEQALRQHFSHVSMLRKPGLLVVTEAEPLAEYVLSMALFFGIAPSEHASLLDFIRAELHTHGPIHMATDSGLLIAH
ncbi:MAG: class I SAM-dependent methyltransferase [Herpetosiphon sp.]